MRLSPVNASLGLLVILLISPAAWGVPFPGRDPVAVSWGPCGYTFPAVPSNAQLSCANVTVPLDWSGAVPGQIVLHMSRVRMQSTASPDSNTQMWMMQGGPGGSGQTMLQFAVALPLTTSVTMYFPDHRGTGLSSPLFCPAGTTPSSDACIDYLLNTVGAARLQAYSTTNAAFDLAYLMRCVAMTDRGPIVPYGASYGTYWLNRFLVLFGGNNVTWPDGQMRPFVSGAVMDGVVHPLYLSISQYPSGVDLTLRNLLSYCAQDPFCAAMFPDNTPIVVLRNILNDLDAGTQACANRYFPTVTGNALRTFLFQLIQPASNYYNRNIIPALIFRIVRCTADDAAALRRAFTAGGSAGLGQSASGRGDAALRAASVAMLGPSQHGAHGTLGDPFAFNAVLNYNIVLSELYTSVSQTAPTMPWLQREESSCLASPVDAMDYQRAWPGWPVYPPDVYRPQVAPFAPVLMLSGELDPSATAWFAADLSILTPQRTLLQIPLAGHVTALMAVPAVGLNCSLSLVLAFVQRPTAALDTGCVAALPRRPDFAGSTAAMQAVAQTYFGGSSLWGCAGPAPCPVPLAGVQRVRPSVCGGVECLGVAGLVGIGVGVGAGVATAVAVVVACVVRRGGGSGTSALLEQRLMTGGA